MVLSKFTTGQAGFMGSTPSYQDAVAVLYGAPMDFTVSFRPGARMGPQKIREVSYGIEEYSPYLERELGEAPYYDAGDLALPFGNVSESLRIIREATAVIVADGKIPFLIGGEHLVSGPAISAVYEKYPDLAVIHFDAHADLRPDYSGEPNSHATVMRRAAEEIGPDRIYQFGIRSGTREEFEYAKKYTRTFPFQVLEPLRQVLAELKTRPVYLSIDIDVVDPAFAPGTGTPEPGGCTSAELIEAVHLLGQCRVVGFDVVEVAPVYDQSERTSLLAAKIIREAILSFL